MVTRIKRGKKTRNSPYTTSTYRLLDVWETVNRASRPVSHRNALLILVWYRNIVNETGSLLPEFLTPDTHAYSVYCTWWYQMWFLICYFDWWIVFAAISNESVVAVHHYQFAWFRSTLLSYLHFCQRQFGNVEIVFVFVVPNHPKCFPKW